MVLPERTLVLWRDPTELLRDNPAALIINRVSYDSMVASPSEARYMSSPPHIARVRIYTPNGEVETELIIDGLTRTKFAADHKGQILQAAPNMKFDQIRVVDITDDLLKDESIVPEKERQKNQTSLTLIQYLRAVIPWTVEHQAIAPERIAGHLINSWRGMVGDDLAAKFPALAALSFIANQNIDISTERGFRKSLAEQERFIVDEKSEEKERLEKALCDIAEIIRKSGLLRGIVAESAYSLIGTKSAVIGGSEGAQKEIFGLLHSHSFESKLRREYLNRLAEAERVRIEFSRALQETFARLSASLPGNESERSEARRALNDISLNIEQTLQIITAGSPMKKSNEIKVDLNRQILKRYYHGLTKKGTLTQDEKMLINNLGGHTNLEETKLPGMAEDIRTAATILRQSRQWQDNLRNGLDNMVNRGVGKDTIEQALASMSQRQETVLSAATEGALSERARLLQKTVAEFQEKVGREILQFEIGQIVATVMEEELKTTKDLYLQKRLVTIIIEDRNVDATDKAAVTRWIQGFRALDAHVQKEVLQGSIPMAAAIRMHKVRQSLDRPPEAKPPEAVPVPTVPFQLIEDYPQISPEEIKHRRIERNIERLQREVIEAHLEPAIRILATLDLAAEEVPLPVKKILGDAVRIIEKLRSGHPDVVRVMDKDYNNLLEETARLRSMIATIQRQQADRDTYSGQNS